MEQVRIAKLDNLCESIAETRSDIRELEATETGNEQAALRVMQQHNTSAYRHAGVELLRVPGDEKLRVRTSKEKATSGQTSDAGEGGGEGEDAGIDQTGDVGTGAED